MKIIFLVDSNKESGLGHLSRNIVFAKELKKKKFNIIFFVTSYFAKQICFKEGFMAEKKNNLDRGGAGTATTLGCPLHYIELN